MPGVYAQFPLTDAVVQPRIAGAVASARRSAATAAVNENLHQTALAYLELLRAHQEVAIAQEMLTNVQDLADLTRAYAKSGQGLEADHNRAQAELAVRKNDVIRAEEATRVASARLAELLRRDPATPLRPLEPTVVPIDLHPPDTSVRDLVAEGLAFHAEVAENRSLVAAAVDRLRRERYAPLIPSVLLGVSYGSFGGGLGGRLEHFGDRLDTDVAAYWEVRNLGFGERAARAQACSRLSQAELREMAVLDRIAREIVESHVQVQSRHRQLQTAREGIQAAVDSHRRNLKRIREAQGLPIEVLQSIQALAQARREYLRVVTDYNIAQFSLHRALGWPSDMSHARSGRPDT
jgi:outer membrane protein TolC